MASPLRLTLTADVPAAIGAIAWATVRAEFEASEQAMSRFRDSSGLTALNRAATEGRAIVVEWRLRQAIVAADRAHRLTGGRFDARVIRDLDRLGYRGVALPSPREGDGPGTLPPPARQVTRGPGGALRIAVPVDLGGIGKGLALRWAAAEVGRLLGPGDGALLEAGGDLAAVGTGPDTGTWPIGIEDPGGGEDLAVVGIGEAALATSSVRITRWTGPDGTTTHHLLDPRTGRPGGAGLLAVTVAGPDPAWAEVRTKELFLAGSTAIGAHARRLGLAAWWVLEDGSLEMTPAARTMTVWVAAEAARALTIATPDRQAP